MTPRPPNILWICTDQQRYDTIHALGNEVIRTPNLDRLCAEGVAFTQAYCQSPVCTPSRASFLTGRYPSNIGVHRNGNACFPADVELITKRLANAGYDCGLVGKLHLAAAEGRIEPRVDDGYRVFRWSHAPKPRPGWPPEAHAYHQWLIDQGVDWDTAYGGDATDGWRIQGEYRPGIAARYHQNTWCAEEAIAFITETRQGPWLLSVNPFDPHPPMDPAPEYFARMDIEAMPLPIWCEDEAERQSLFRRVDHQTKTPIPPDSYHAQAMVAAYYAQIEHLDHEVGRILAALEASGQREDTIVIYTSDHGEMLGDHGLRLKGCRFYEGAVHVPLIISWPGHFESGLVSDALVELVDLAPTLLDAAALPVPPEMQGWSLYPLLIGRGNASSHRPFVRCEYHDALALPKASRANMLFDGRYKLVVYHGHDVGELYDLQDDPLECRNLWLEPEHTELKLALMRQMLDAALLATNLGQPRVGGY